MISVANRSGANELEISLNTEFTLGQMRSGISDNKNVSKDQNSAHDFRFLTLPVDSWGTF